MFCIFIPSSKSEYSMLVKKVNKNVLYFRNKGLSSPYLIFTAFHH